MSAALSVMCLKRELDSPVLKVRASFSLARQAMAAPGQIQRADEWMYVQSPLDEATFALCVALLDVDSQVWLGPSLDTPGLRMALAIHCGCTFVELRQAARFALLGVAELDNLADFDNGLDACPGRACTLIVQLDNLAAGPELRWRGPGIKQVQRNGVIDVRRVRLPLAETFWEQRSARNNFPQGLDIYFSAGRQLLALPRSTHVFASEADTELGA
ncbi:phosphonate C-P lyase system protein PhnH [Pseudomonas sp. M30-35]|uniref:phosphonate C-P lyase system protein PhnH n=1 Tax=Pseudomonas sp. M30-35 TaxID=1981174 RepID=UPI000B3C03F7|nr:phosphonate C-P lyase system protein PhnH [Pseudomonas sp. M30-35]ARU89210.1 phosphonate C-P lyase system protein PhnH [Pseudomonas sp. M30-35]